MAKVYDGSLKQNVGSILLTFRVGKDPLFDIERTPARKRTPFIGRRVPGDLFVTLTQNVSPETLACDLTHADYSLVHVIQDEAKTENGDFIFLAKFIFARRDTVENADRRAFLDTVAMQKLDELLSQQCWNIAAWNNPRYRDNKPVRGQRSISITFGHPSLPGMKTDKIRGILSIEDRKITFSPIGEWVEKPKKAA